MATTIYDMAMKYYPKMWSKDRLQTLVEAGKLTKTEMEEIITKKGG